MLTIHRAVATACISLVLAGCAGVPQNRTLGPAVAAAIQPVDVRIGIKQPELIAEFEPSNIAAGAMACGIVPGVGILLAAACGGAMGAMDATVNAQRAKAADELARPLKNAVLDVQADQLFTDAIGASLRAIPSLQVAGLKLTKQVDDKAYEETFRAATTSGVMFTNVEYSLAKDFSAVNIRLRASLFARSPAARAAAGKTANLPEPGKGSPVMLHDAAYWMDVAYRGTLPRPGTPAANIEAWRAGDAALLRSALQDGARQVARLLAEDMQRRTERPAVVAKVDTGGGMLGELVGKQDGGELYRFPFGGLLYKTTVTPSAALAMAQPKPQSPAQPQAQPQASQPSVPTTTAAVAPVAAPHSNTTLVAPTGRQVYEYEWRDRLGGSTRRVTWRLDRRDGDKLVFNDGTRIETATGGVVHNTQRIGGEFDTAMPPGGWIPMEPTPGATWQASFERGVSTGFISLKVEARAGAETTMRLKDRDLRIVPVEYTGYTLRNSAVNNPGGRYAATAWYAPELHRIVRFEVKTRGGLAGGAFFIDEQLTLVDIRDE